MSKSQEVQVKETLNHMKKLANQSEELTNNTGVQLHKQRQQLERMNDDAKQLNKEVDAAHKKTKRISSFWYWVKDSVRNYVKPNKNNPTDNSEPKKVQEMPQKKQQLVKQQSPNCEGEYDEEIGDLCEQMKRVKMMNCDINRELCQQINMADRLDKETEKASTKMDKVNRKMRKDILKQ